MPLKKKKKKAVESLKPKKRKVVKKKTKIAKPIERPRRLRERARGVYHNLHQFTREKIIEDSLQKTFQRHVGKDGKTNFGFAMDSSIKPVLQSSFTGISEAQLAWYSSQNFIGFQICALLSQNWLINKACTMPAEDAVRTGFEITVNDGSSIPTEILDGIKQADIRYRLNENLIEFIRFCRIYGIRIAKFEVESKDPRYYEKPFNLDGVEPGSYKGITQIDPYWCVPELDMESLVPGSMYFYEPTYWIINAKRIHRTHLIIARTCKVPDILKPTYIYAGIPVPQSILDRVYAAERCANEAPQLMMTKRMPVMKTDLVQGVADQEQFENTLGRLSFLRDNYGVNAIGLDDEMTQLDTSLADCSDVIMTQFQLVAAGAEVPATKLLGTTPKGFNATGEYDERSYHEKLESLQAHLGTPLIERHHALLIRSEILPEMPFETTTKWNKVSTLSELDLATINKTKADTGNVLITSGAIDGVDERERIINDKTSGYNGLESAAQSDPETAPESSETLNDPEEEGSMIETPFFNL